MFFKKAFTLVLFATMTVFLACSNGSERQREQAEAKPRLPVITEGQFTYDDQSYPTIRLNDLTWLAINLDVKTEDSWCFDGKPGNCQTYGRLYRWAAAKEACQQLGAGWRLPSEEEWRSLALAYGGFQDWTSTEPEGDAVAANRALQSGKFQAQRGGWRGSAGGFDDLGEVGFYWTATAVDDISSWFFMVYPEGRKLTRRQGNPRMGMSCRCVR